MGCGGGYDRFGHALISMQVRLLPVNRNPGYLDLNDKRRDKVSTVTSQLSQPQ